MGVQLDEDATLISEREESKFDLVSEEPMEFMTSKWVAKSQEFVGSDSCPGSSQKT